MSNVAPRRRVLRPPAAASAEELALARRAAKAREQLTKERTSLKCWFTRLRRAFTTVDKLQQRIARLEKITN